MYMAEVIHEHVAADSSSSTAMGIMIGIIMLIVVAAIALYFFGTGRLFGGPSTTSTPQINVPKQVDVNVNNK